MQLRLHHALIAAVLVLLVSCKQTNEPGRYIPANATAVLQLDSKSLSAKLPWAEVKDNTMFRELYDDTAMNATLKKLLDNPASTGIDVQADFIFYMQKDSVGAYIGFEGNLTDEAAFATINKELMVNGSASDANGVNYISKAPACVGWNDKKFVYIFNAPQLVPDGLSQRMKDDSIDTRGMYPARDLGATCRSIFGMEEKNSLAVNERFGNMLKTPGDMHFWINTAEAGKFAFQSGATGSVNLDKLTKENVTTGAVNFENGKVNVSLLSFSGKELSALFKKYSGGKVNEAMLKRLPEKYTLGMFALNFDPKGLRELLVLLNLDGFVNAAQPMLGINLDDLINATKGDIAIGIAEPQLTADTIAQGIPEDPILRTLPKRSPGILFATSVNNKEAFNKLINAGRKAGDFLGAMGLPQHYNNNEQFFAIGTVKQDVDQFVAGSNGNQSDIVKQIGGHPFGGYVNLQKVMKSAAANDTDKDSITQRMNEASIQLWNSLLWTGGDFKDGGLAQNIEINLLDQKTNSLKQLNKYFYQMAALNLIKKRKQQEDMQAFKDANIPGTVQDSTMKPISK